MSDKTVSVGLKIEGDSKSAQVAIEATEKGLLKLDADASKIRLMEGAVESVDRFKAAVAAAQAKVGGLQSALSEAYASGADAPLIRNLERNLDAATRAAANADATLQHAQATIVGLNLRFGEAGVTTGNLAVKKAELAAEADRLAKAMQEAAKAAQLEANYQSYLRAELERVAAAEKKAAEAADFEKQRQKAIGYQKAAEYAGWWATELDKVEKAERAVAARTDRVNASFAQLGIRSAAKIEADIQAINQALSDLARRSNLSGEEFDRAWAAGQAQIAKLKGELAGLPVEQTAGSVGGLTGAFSSLQGVLGALGISAVGEKFLHANMAADKLQKSLNAVNGDAKKTESDLAFLKETAQRLGINLESSSAAFVKLAAAAKGTSLEGQATRDIFTGLGGAMSQLGLSAAETERAFVAVGQMMSKGTVGAEELKGQLGDVLPGAMQIMARATNLSVAELNKLMEAGGLLAEDALPKFAAEAQKSFGGAGGEVQGMSNSIERLKNTWSQAFKIFGDTGVLASLGGAVGFVSEAFLILATGVTTVVAGFFAFVKAIAVTVAAIATLDFSGLKTSLADIGNELVNNVTKMASLTHTSKLVGEAMNDAGTATQQGASAAKAAGAGWEKLVVAYDQAIKSAADYVAMAKKVTTANNDQAEVLVKIATLSGNENQLLRAKEDAARQAAEGAHNLADALDREAKTLQAKQIALQEEIKGLKNVSEEKLKAIEEAKKLAEAKTEEARASRAGADTARVAAAAAEAESAARYDNSLRVKELKEAYEQAAIQVDVLRAAQASGVDVTAQLTVAQTAAAKAHALLNDALADQAKKIQDTNALKQAQLSLEGTTIKLAIEQQRTIYEVARARGDEYGAMQALLQMKRLEIQLAELTANAKRLEAQAALAKVQADREELQAKGQLTEAASLELQAREAAAGVKLKEAEIAKELSKRMRELLDANQASGNAAGRSAGGYDNMANSMNRAADAARNLRNAQAGGSEGGGSSQATIGASGSVVDDPTYDHDTFNNGGHQASVSVSSRAILYKSGASIEEAKAAEKYFGELFQRLMVAGSDSVRSTEGNNRLIAESSKAAAEAAIRLAKQELATGQAADLGNSVSDLIQKNLAQLSNRNFGQNSATAFAAMKSTVAASGREAQQQTIRLELGSGDKKSTLFASSQADAMDFIRTLEAAGMRAAR